MFLKCLNWIKKGFVIYCLVFEFVWLLRGIIMIKKGLFFIVGREKSCK